ncbi:MAG: asparagine synthase (glutamine-hydrolyzing) [Phycisphaerales bacterium]|nr:asparagine synthase (glutamine-hydrolyzing) [Phycisphaerales bacterium]
MCGIAGIVDLDGRLGPERLRELAAAMNATMVHRGPDDAGVWVDAAGRCALAQRRLSIVDLSPLGHQPMVLDGGEAALTFNGEIYNFMEIRRRLESQGHRFGSRCDAEVLLHLMAGQHVDRLDSLRGMYAFALWSARQRSLLLARDPFGKKPLYLARGRGWFAFASELRALEVIDELDRTIAAESLADYLLLQYVHAPRSIYQGVEKLEPGCWLTLDAQGRERRGRHFTFTAGDAEAEVQLASTREGRVAQLDALLTQAVERRLISDVPLGAFLSGGIDSALVVSRMRRLGVHTKTYSVGFADSPESEHVQAREIAAHLGCEHHDIVLRPDAIELAPLIAARLDEPNGDSSCLPTYLLAEFTRRHVTVALSGDGGDEMFGGYGRYFDTLADVTVDAGAGAVASSLYLGPRLTIFQPPDLARFLGEVPAATQAGIARWSAMLDRADRPLIHNMRRVDVESYLPGAVLAKVDRMSMQHSLEVRCPLLDLDVARFAAALGADDLIAHSRGANGRPTFTGKRILKDLLARELPHEWVHRRKRGFGLPAGFWDGPALRSFAHDLLAGPDTVLADWLDHRQLKGWLVEQENPQCFSIYRLWPMLILELWLRESAARRRAAGGRRPVAAAAGHLVAE